MEMAPLISHLKVFVSFACNLKCPHCVHGRFPSVPDPPFDEVFLEKLGKFLREIGRYNPALNIYLSGGEPLMAPRFFQAAESIRSTGLTYKTITNGLLLSLRLEKLIANPPHSIWMTFNGLGERHDAMVGRKGAYEKLIRSLNRSLPVLKKHQIRTGAVLMINSSTFGSLSTDMDEIGSLGFDEVVVQHLSFLPDQMLKLHKESYLRIFGTPSGFCFGEGANGYGIDPDVLSRELSAIRQKKTSFRKVIFPDFSEIDDLADYYGQSPKKWQSRRCLRAPRELWVMPDGRVTGCFAHPFGDIGQSFASLVSSPHYEQWNARILELKKPLPGCVRCHRLYMN